MAVVGIDHLYAGTAGRERPVPVPEGPGFAFPERWGSEDRHRLTCSDPVGVLAGAPPAKPLTVDLWFRAAGPDGRTPEDPGHR